MKKVLDRFSRVLITVSGLLFLVIFLLNMAEIISRTFLSHSILWVSDVCTICVVWMICLGIASCVYLKEHIFMDFLANAMSPKLQKVVRVIVVILTVAFYAMLFITGIQTAITKIALEFPTTQWSLVWSYSAIPAFALVSAIFMIPRLIEAVKGKESVKQEA